MTDRRYDAVVFDLLAALLDAWTVWSEVAGSREQGEAWRRAYLRITYACGAYRPYEDLVAAAAETVGLDRALAACLSARYAEHRPWPGVAEVLGELRARGARLGVATNCSRDLGRLAAAQVGIPFDVVVTAEEAGFYKPRPEPYRMALARLAIAPARALFVAGSAMDVPGARGAGMDVFWHNRWRLPLADPAHHPIATAETLAPLLDLV